MTGQTSHREGAAAFLWRHRLWWLIPLVIVLALVGALLFLVQGGSETPFVYPRN